MCQAGIQKDEDVEAAFTPDEMAVISAAADVLGYEEEEEEEESDESDDE